MLIILDKPSPNGELAVNTDAYEIFCIRQMDDAFKLVCQKSFDAYFSNMSSMFFVIYTFDSREKCLHLFQAIVDAIRTGKPVFDLSADYLEKQTPVSDALKADNIPAA